MATTPASTVSPTLSPMSNIGYEREGTLSVQMLNLTVEQPNTNDDSFSSSPDSLHNKGALAFLDLVERALEMGC